MSKENKLAGVPLEVLPMLEMLQGLMGALDQRRAHAQYAAAALQALITANVRPGVMIDGSSIIADAWRFADAMMAAQQAREAEAAGASSLASVLAQGSA